MRPDRIVRCSEPDCREPATFKVAAAWSDEHFSGLRTYGFACLEHLKELLRSAEARWLAYQAVPEETVQELGIYRIEAGKLDSQLVRDLAIEEIFFA